jgi:hypothetical protein
MRVASNLATLFYLLGAIAKLRESILSSVMSVCMPVHLYEIPRFALDGFS